MRIETLINEMESATDWIQPGNVGDTGGGSSKPNGAFAFRPACVAQFSAQGAYPYNNGFFYRKLGAFNHATEFEYAFEVMFPTAADLAASQAIEFELQQNVESRIYNMAWQANFAASKMWRTFDYGGSAWVASSVGIDDTTFIAGVWTRILAKFRRGADLTMTHVSLAVNDRVTPVNFMCASTPRVESDYVHCAFQMDSNGDATPTPYNVAIRNMRVRLS